MGPAPCCTLPRPGDGGYLGRGRGPRVQGSGSRCSAGSRGAGGCPAGSGRWRGRGRPVGALRGGSAPVSPSTNGLNYQLIAQRPSGALSWQGRAWPLPPPPPPPTHLTLCLCWQGRAADHLVRAGGGSPTPQHPGEDGQGSHSRQTASASAPGAAGSREPRGEPQRTPLAHAEHPPEPPRATGQVSRERGSQ